MTWYTAEVAPVDLSTCVVLVRDEYGLWKREFAQFGGRWMYLGSSMPLRGVEYWCPLPKLPDPVFVGAKAG